ncbi:MAG: hypothetical protein IT324_01370 [Anaerolineae bacterium]|nr:hypothetical protein [Anaerolineae bacterium]
MKSLSFVLFMLPGLAVLLLAWADYDLIKQLKKEGITVNAEIISKRITRDKRWRHGYITFRFRSGSSNDTTLYTYEQMVSAEDCEALSVGATIPVQFLQSNPLETVRLANNIIDNTFDIRLKLAIGLMLIVFLGGMYLFFVK